MRGPQVGRRVGILSALPEETRLLVGELEGSSEHAAPGLTAWLGRLDGLPVVVANAGVGKVNAATTATLLVERHGCRALVLSGVAGGLSGQLAIGDLVLATRVVDVDYGRWTDDGRVTYRPGSLPLPGVEPAPGIPLEPGLEADVCARLTGLDVPVTPGTVLSGDAFLASTRIRDQLAARWSALAIEMEGSGVCGVAERLGVPWLIVRALSDLAGEASSVDFEAFLASASERSARLVRDLLPIVAAHARS